MLSLLSPIITRPSFEDDGHGCGASQEALMFLPQDCINHMFQYADVDTKLSMFLVCHSWYHATDRSLCLANTFYYFPDLFRSKIIERHTFTTDFSERGFKNGGSLMTFQSDVRWEHLEMVFLKVLGNHHTKDLFESLPPCIQELSVRVDKEEEEEEIRVGQQLTSYSALRRLDLVGHSLTSISLCGLGSLPSLQHITLHTTNITDLSSLSACQMLRSIEVHECYNLSGIGGLERIPT
eukprot:PhF_6_TR7306/c0_g1_i2/m.10946